MIARGPYESGTFWSPETGALLNESGALLNESGYHAGHAPPGYEVGALLNESGFMAGHAPAGYEVGAKTLTDAEKQVYGIDQATYDTLAATPCPAGCYNVFAAGEETNPAMPPCFNWQDNSVACGSGAGGGTGPAPTADPTHKEIQTYLALGFSFSEALLKTFGLQGPPAGWAYEGSALPQAAPAAFRWEYVALGVAGLAAVFLLAGKK
jgi:hypothetical protein